MTKSNYSAPWAWAIDIAWEEMGIGRKSESVSRKGFGPVSKIRPALCHWLCFDWFHPLLMFFTYFPPLYCPCLDSKSHLQQNVESVGSIKFASHLNNDDSIPLTLLQAALPSAPCTFCYCFCVFLCVLCLMSLLCAPPTWLVKWVMGLDQPWLSVWHEYKTWTSSMHCSKCWRRSRSRRPLADSDT